MFGPRDQEPIPLQKARTFDLVFEGGKPFVVFSYGNNGEWMKLEINNDQLWHWFNRAAPKLRGR